jgi:hypothetical protein
MEGHVKKRKSQRSAPRAKEDRNVLEENSGRKLLQTGRTGRKSRKGPTPVVEKKLQG